MLTTPLLCQQLPFSRPQCWLLRTKYLIKGNTFILYSLLCGHRAIDVCLYDLAKNTRLYKLHVLTNVMLFYLALQVLGARACGKFCCTILALVTWKRNQNICCTLLTLHTWIRYQNICCTVLVLVTWTRYQIICCTILTRLALHTWTQYQNIWTVT